jgi:hypothetical protein
MEQGPSHKVRIYCLEQRLSKRHIAESCGMVQWVIFPWFDLKSVHVGLVVDKVKMVFGGET